MRRSMAASVRRAVSALVMTVSASVALAGDGAPLTIGSPAPDFTLPYATKEQVSFDGVTLSTVTGTSVIVLAFYPADWSSGCTKEMCALRDAFSSLNALHAKVFGISGDYVFSHHEWAKALRLQFTLLSDHRHQVAKLYQSFDDATGYNMRTVFVIDRQGRIAYVDRDYDVASDEEFHRLQDAIAAAK